MIASLLLQIFTKDEEPYTDEATVPLLLPTTSEQQSTQPISLDVEEGQSIAPISPNQEEGEPASPDFESSENEVIWF